MISVPFKLGQYVYLIQLLKLEIIRGAIYFLVVETKYTLLLFDFLCSVVEWERGVLPCGTMIDISGVSTSPVTRLMRFGVTQNSLILALDLLGNFYDVMLSGAKYFILLDV